MPVKIVFQHWNNTGPKARRVVRETPESSGDRSNVSPESDKY